MQPRPDWELEYPEAAKKVRKEFRQFKNWNLAEIEEHEDRFESEFPNNFSNRYGIQHFIDIQWGVCIYGFVTSRLGLHIDEVYHSLIHELRGAPRVRRLAIKAFLEEFGHLRLKWSEDGSRDYGNPKFFIEGCYVTLNEAGVLVKREYEDDFFLPVPRRGTVDVQTERDMEKAKTRTFPYWDEDKRYWTSPDQFYQKVTFRAHFCGVYVRGGLWMVFDRLPDEKIYNFNSYDGGLGLSLSCFYETRTVYKDGMAWRRNVAPSEVACYLITLWREEGERLSWIAYQLKYLPWQLKV